jgi:hypothetical protein
MFSHSCLAAAVAIPLTGALALTATEPASALTIYGSPAALKAAGAPAAEPVYYRYRHWGGGYYRYGFPGVALGVLGAIAGAPYYGCGGYEYGYGYGYPYGCYGYPYSYGYGGPYYGGWGGYGGYRHFGHGGFGGGRFAGGLGRTGGGFGHFGGGVRRH